VDQNRYTAAVACIERCRHSGPVTSAGQVTAALILAALALGAWIYLLFARGGFWRGAQRDDCEGLRPEDSKQWPRVVAVIPARNEADVVALGVDSLLRQNYPGPLTVILVDDQSDDDTSGKARQAAIANQAADRLIVVPGAPVPTGWTGKLWAVMQGMRYIERLPHPPDYLLLTDADIVYSHNMLTTLVARAGTGAFVLTSLMAKLRCESAVERAFVPAFIFFFQMLYPFAWVNRTSRRTAAAAGGCMLVQRDALEASGGIEAIRGELIDDCALARQLKARGPIWLGLTEGVRSVRPYRRLGDIRRMVARCAYTQLRHSRLLLLVCVAGMTLTFLAPPVLALFSAGLSRVLAITAWISMALAFQPTLRLYRISPLWAALLPGIAAAYLLFTLDSALQHWRGAGGMWKGRAQALRSQSR
jgi:hopene-associated glycosyltransferase HpnB